MAEVAPPQPSPEAPRVPRLPDRPKDVLAQRIATEIRSRRLKRELPDSTLREILRVRDEKREANDTQKESSVLQTNESAYFEEVRQKVKPEELTGRYNDPRTEASFVRAQVEGFAWGAGLKQETVTDEQKAFGAETRARVGEVVQQHIDRLLNSEQGIRNSEKHKLVSDETQRYLDLMAQAQAEGDIPADLDAQAVLQLATENVWKLAYQDRAARENWMGDHGVRHLVGHNIHVTEALFDELARNGQQVKAVDRLIGHQVMIDHDMGYAMDPVRDPVKAGKFGADAGHNLLAAKFVRQQGEQNAALGKVFTTEQQVIIHEGILHHDSSSIDFKVGDSSQQTRKENIYSAIHTADNTHAFEDKLPEILYSYPDTLRSLRLMKTAGEVGDAELFHSLQAQLVEGIEANTAFTADDKEALVNAASNVTPDNYRFAVGRICGNKPEFAMRADGGLTITVEQSAIHEEVVSTFAGETNEQLRKFVADLTGQDKKDVNLDQDVIVSSNGKLEIRTKIGKQKASENRTDYQKRVEEIVKDKGFQKFLVGSGDHLGDASLASEQALAQKMFDTAAEGSGEKQAFGADVQRIKQQRGENLVQYMQGRKEQ